jgi:hypothetical protein
VAVLAALAFACVWAAILGLVWHWTRGLPVARSYYLAYALSGVAFAVVVTVVTAAFPGRNAFRVCLAFSLASAAGMPTQLQHLAEARPGGGASPFKR